MCRHRGTVSVYAATLSAQSPRSICRQSDKSIKRLVDKSLLAGALRRPFRARSRFSASPARRPRQASAPSRPAAPAPTTTREAARRPGRRRWWRRASATSATSELGGLADRVARRSGCIGSPTVTAMVLPREKSRGWSLVIIRWVPHRITGTSGYAGLGRDAYGTGLELLELHGSRDRGLGEDADGLARLAGSRPRSRSTLSPDAAVHLDVVQRAHQRAERPVVEELALGHEAHQASARGWPRDRRR